MSTRGVLLDVDGTLLDSNEAHATAYARAMAEEGLDVPVARILPLIGMGGDKLLPALGIEPNSRVGEHVARRKKELFEEKFLPSLKPFPATRDLLDHMKRLGLELVIATSAEGDELRGLLRRAGIEDLLDAKTSSSDANGSKPDPDILQAAIARSHFPREELVMLGDSPYDVEAARRAGLRVVAVRCGGRSNDELKGADEIYDSPADLLARFDDSIFV